jgi:hypothetical protein
MLACVTVALIPKPSKVRVSATTFYYSAFLIQVVHVSFYFVRA